MIGKVKLVRTFDLLGTASIHVRGKLSRTCIGVIGLKKRYKPHSHRHVIAKDFKCIRKQVFYTSRIVKRDFSSVKKTVFP